jgi:hypothetical protein
MKKKKNRPILVTGAHRSGTTWVGRMLSAGGETCYIHEPFNPTLRIPSWLSCRFPFWFYHIPPGGDPPPPCRAALDRLLRLVYPAREKLALVRSPGDLRLWIQHVMACVLCRRRGKRPLVKDPIALFSAEWLAQTYGMAVVVMIRHPAAFAASLKRYGWDFDFRHWWVQSRLMDTLLRDLAPEIQAQIRDTRPIVEQAALLWKGIYSVVLQYRSRHPTWIFLRHEDLTRDPLTAFRDLYRRLGLTWNRRVSRTIQAHTHPRKRAQDPFSLRRDPREAREAWRSLLSEEEQALVDQITGPVARHFYPEAYRESAGEGNL